MLEQGISFIHKSAAYERYQLPIEIQGETACVRLTVQGNSEEKGKVSIQISTQEAGEMYGEFWLNENKLKGNIFVQEDSWKDYIQQHISENLWLMGQVEENKGADNRQLFTVAKQFITAVKGWVTEKASQN